MPQLAQNLAAPGSSVPHSVQCFTAGAIAWPQPMQNFAPAGFDVEQLAQATPVGAGLQQQQAPPPAPAPAPAPAAAAAPAPAPTGVACANCSTSNPAGAKFCMGCGQPMAPAVKHCTECGTELPGAAKFCANCGTPAG